MVALRREGVTAATTKLRRLRDEVRADGMNSVFVVLKHRYLCLPWQQMGTLSARWECIAC